MLKLQESSISWALKNINRYSDTYIFPTPFEFEAINANWDEVKKILLSMDVYQEGMRPYRTALTPKSTIGFRISTQLDPLDSIITNAVIYEIYDEIETVRVPKSKKRVFSFRLKPESDGKMYDKDFNWNAFQEATESYIADCDWVLVTDIADFFPSIYLHNIETVLYECVAQSGKHAHAQVLINKLKAMHLSQTHKGIPVGPQFSRPIAELILDAVDRELLDNGIEFVRYVDDYRIFCKSEPDAYSKLAFLAQNLYDLRNLKLNEQKTAILPCDKFKKAYLKSPKERINASILENLNELLKELGINPDPYEEIDIDSLDKKDRERLGKINLEKVLKDELNKDAVDYGFVIFLLGNLTRFDNTAVAELLLEDGNIKKLFPNLRNIILYLEKVRSFSNDQKHFIGSKIIKLLNEGFISNLAFNRMWLLNLFTKDDEWDNEDVFVALLRKYNDSLTMRELYLALGRSKNIHFFQNNKNMTLNIDPWLKRAFIASISCLPESECNPWYKAKRLMKRDYMEDVVSKWAEQNHF